MPRIRVHEKALAHLSRGLYRSPASALRELVSNAWDASATVIRIDTNYPNFFQLSIEDNGDGFTKEEFERLMSGGIGSSLKRPSNVTPRFGRPLIGRLGIGMLGIAQICGSFIVMSTPKHGAPFRARVKLYDLLKVKLDTDSPDVVESDGRTVAVDVGEYDFEKGKDERKQPGTTIIADDIHPTFTRSFQESLEFQKFRPPLDWKRCLKVASTVRSLQELGDYWRLLWELAAACPVPYIDETAVPHGMIKHDQSRLESFRFKVIVDGRELLKPSYLKGNKDGYTTKRIPAQTYRIYGETLAFHGYIAVQEGKQLRPDELRGIAVRIKDVAIGYYDPSMLDYRFNEGPRSRWLTGEVFVSEGLEDALNIDRDSFNRFHPQFRKLQSVVHDVLRDEVFPDVYQQIRHRSERRDSEKRSKQRTALKSVLTENARAHVSVRVSDKAAADVTVRRGGGRAELIIPSESTANVRRTHRELFTALMAIFDVATLERDRAAQRDKFLQLLTDLLARW